MPQSPATAAGPAYVTPAPPRQFSGRYGATPSSSAAATSRGDGGGAEDDDEDEPSVRPFGAVARRNLTDHQGSSLVDGSSASQRGAAQRPKVVASSRRGKAAAAAAAGRSGRSTSADDVDVSGPPGRHRAVPQGDYDAGGESLPTRRVKPGRDGYMVSHHASDNDLYAAYQDGSDTRASPPMQRPAPGSDNDDDVARSPIQHRRRGSDNDSMDDEEYFEGTGRSFDGGGGLDGPGVVEASYNRRASAKKRAAARAERNRAAREAEARDAEAAAAGLREAAVDMDGGGSGPYGGGRGGGRGGGLARGGGGGDGSVDLDPEEDIPPPPANRRAVSAPARTAAPSLSATTGSGGSSSRTTTAQHRRPSTPVELADDDYSGELSKDPSALDEYVTPTYHS